MTDAEDRSTIERELSRFLVEECGLPPADATPSTPLFSSQLLHSIDIVRLVSFIEQRFAFRVPAMEVSVDTFDSIEAMVDFIQQQKR